MKLPDKIYDLLKWVAQIVLPALGTLYFTIASIWGLPYAEQVVGTVTAVDAFLGVVLGISTVSYKKSDNFGDGTLKIDETNPNKDVYKMELNCDIADLKDKKSVTFKVDKNVK